ncbi:MAG: hypothetical protein ACREBS_09860 [Nitrososphaerales archaeon]
MPKTQNTSREDRTIKVTLQFSTDRLPQYNKICRSSGWVVVQSNKSHGIGASKRNPKFKNLSAIPTKVEIALQKAGVILSP